MASKKKTEGVKGIFRETRAIRQREVDALVSRLAQEESLAGEGLANLGAGLGLSAGAVAAGQSLPSKEASTARVGVLRDSGREQRLRGIHEDWGRLGYLNALDTGEQAGVALRDQLAAGVELAGIQADAASAARADARRAQAQQSSLAQQNFDRQGQWRAEDIARADAAQKAALEQSAGLTANAILADPAFDTVLDIRASGTDQSFSMVPPGANAAVTFDGLNDFYAFLRRNYGEAVTRIIDKGIVEDELIRRATAANKPPAVPYNNPVMSGAFPGL